jgi:DNA repair protein RecO (recombination protein O)
MRWQTEAIVLGAADRGESDRLVQLFTPAAGRLWVMAKGALKSRKRFSGMFEPPQVVEVGLMSGARGGRPLIEHADLVAGFAEFRQGPERLCRAHALIELARALVAEESPAPGLYALLRRGLFHLQQDPDRDRWLLAFAFRLLSAAGHKPELTACVCCLKGVRREAVFLAEEGGVVCPACADRRVGLPVSADTTRTLEAIMAASEANLSRLRFTANSLCQSRSLLEHFIAHQLPEPSRSLSVLRELEGRGGR